jgi:hypothetical protein
MHNSSGKFNFVPSQSHSIPVAAGAVRHCESRTVRRLPSRQPAGDKNPKRRPGGACAQRIGPERQKKRRTDNPPEIGFHTAQSRGGAMTAQGGNRKQQRGEQRGKHQESPGDFRIGLNGLESSGAEAKASLFGVAAVSSRL